MKLYGINVDTTSDGHIAGIEIRKATFRRSRRSGMPRLPEAVATRAGVTPDYSEFDLGDLAAFAFNPATPMSWWNQTPRT